MKGDFVEVRVDYRHGHLMRDVQDKLVKIVLEHHDGDRERAAAELGVSTTQDLLERLKAIVRVRTDDKLRERIEQFIMDEEVKAEPSGPRHWFEPGLPKERADRFAAHGE